MRRRIVSPLLALALSACNACGAPSAPETTPEPPSTPPPTPLSYEVHEWGLIRGTMMDQVMLSGPHRAEIAVPIAKPVLYFHREGEGQLSIDVEVSIASGRVVEHWPLARGWDGSGPLAWRAVEITPGSCAGSSYPSDTQPPCDAIRAPDSCEAASLAGVETTDGDCVRYGGAAFDHLFYRGEITGRPPLPLTLAPGAGSDTASAPLRLGAAAGAAIPGSIVRVRRSSRAVSVVAAPPPGSSVTLPPASAAAATGADALAASLRAAGLTDAEISAFRRAWDVALFGGEIASAAGESPPAVTTIPPVAGASPMGGLVMPASDDAVLYVLPRASADALAPLTFTPPPRAVHRAIVAWIDVASARPARP